MSKSNTSNDTELQTIEQRIDAYQAKPSKGHNKPSQSLQSLLGNKDDRRLNVALRGTLYRNFQILCLLDERSITDVVNELVANYVNQNTERLVNAFVDEMK